MKHAYNEVNLHNLAVIKESKRWCSQGLIEDTQLKNIEQEYRCEFYHPNIIIRILLFVATLFALSGVTGFFALLFGNGGEKVLPLACLIYGVVSFAILDRILISRHRHYKSGVAEALLYHARSDLLPDFCFTPVTRQAAFFNKSFPLYLSFVLALCM